MKRIRFGRRGSAPLHLLLGGLLLLAADAGKSHAGGDELFDNPTLAKGSGFAVRQNEVEAMVDGLKGTLASTRNQTIPDQQRGQIFAQMLDRLVLTRMLEQKASAADKTKAKELADKFVADTKAKARSEDSYRRQLIASGIKPELFESRALEQALVETVLDRELKSKVTISEAQVRDFYEQGVDSQVREIIEVTARMEADHQTNTVFYTDGLARIPELKKANLARLDRPELVKAQVIIVFTIDRITREDLSDEDRAARKERAEKALQRIKAGEDFTKVAKEISEDPEVEKNGGEYVAAREAVAYPELRAVMFSLPAGQVSDLISTRVGFYIAKVLEKTAAGKLPLDKAEKDIRELLTAQEVQKQLPAFFERMKKEFNVVYAGATNAPIAK